jgi:O-antigen/teichoic acid export membrane protein
MRAFLVVNRKKFISQLLNETQRKDSNLLKSVILFISLLSSMGFTFFSSVITARALGPALYGDMKFIVILWTFFSLLVTLGHFHSGGRLLALEKQNENSREIIGIVLLIALMMGGLLVIVNIIIAYPLNQFLHLNITREMIMLAPLTLALPILSALTLILQGSNRIYLLSMLTVVPTILYLLCVLLLNIVGKISPSTIILTQQLTYDIVALFVICRLKPVLKSIPFWWQAIKKQNKIYGTEVYKGSLASIASGYVNRLSLSYWIDNTSIGFFSLASSLVEPLKLLPNAVAVTSFQKFAYQSKISNRVFIATITASVFSLFCALLFFGKAISWIFTKDFSSVGLMAIIGSFGAVLHGFGDIFNRFLGAHGQGKTLRNSAYLVGCVNIIGFFLLVPRFGAWGAVITSYIGVGTCYFIYMLIYYLKFINQTVDESQTIMI